MSTHLAKKQADIKSKRCMQKPMTSKTTMGGDVWNGKGETGIYRFCKH